MGSYRSLESCRLGGQRNLISVLNLGEQALTGVFPPSAETPVTRGPLELLWCPDSGLLQLGHSFDPQEMYGDNYGYRSGLNASMVQHLSDKVRSLERLVQPRSDDVVLDIGSNDGTTLKAYATAGLQRVGIDPTASKWRQYYPDDIAVVPDFFSGEAYRRVTRRSARIVTSIAMLYDLDDPVGFAREVASILASDGVWHFEPVSYTHLTLPTILRV